MQPFKPFRHAQGGAYLLEALIGILIFSFGILGIVGLQAQAIRFTNDAEYRAEAVYMANSLISQMWTDDQATLPAKYNSPAGPEYINFRDNVVAPALHGVMTADPIVEVDPGPPAPAAPSKNKTGAPSRVVQVTIFWQAPGDPQRHNYMTTAVIGQN